MRFKKLRISVAITLIVFILLVGSIIVLGLNKSPQTNLNAVPDNTKKIISNVSASSSQTTDTSSVNTQSSDTSSSSSNSVQSTDIPVMQQQIVNTRVRTRAS